MKAIKNSLRNVRNALRFARQVLRYAALFFWVLLCPKSVLAARPLAAERGRIQRFELSAERRGVRYA